MTLTGETVPGPLSRALHLPAPRHSRLMRSGDAVRLCQSPTSLSSAGTVSGAEGGPGPSKDGTQAPASTPKAAVRSPASLPSPVFCSVLDAHGSNEKFLNDMSDLALRASCTLMVCPRVENRNDRWIQVGEEQPRERGQPKLRPPPRLRGAASAALARLPREAGPGARTRGGRTAWESPPSPTAASLGLSCFPPGALAQAEPSPSWVPGGPPAHSRPRGGSSPGPGVLAPSQCETEAVTVAFPLALPG